MARILVIVTGGVRAPTALDLSERFVADGHEVRILATGNALRFLLIPLLASPGRLLFFLQRFRPQLRETLAYFAYRQIGVPHVEEGRWCDLAVILPATSNSLGKLVSGIADNYPILVARGVPRTKRVLVVPSMNPEMWLDPFLQRNIDLLNTTEKYRVLSPLAGKMASGDYGLGQQVAMEVVIAESYAALGIAVQFDEGGGVGKIAAADQTRFVIVDEDLSLTETLAKTLRKESPAYGVTCFDSADSALAWFRDEDADILMTSLEFAKGASGYDLIQAIKRQPSDKPCQIVATSVRSRTEVGAETLARSDIFFLPKPLNLQFAVGLLTGLTGVRSVAPGTARRHLAAGDVLFREGDESDEVYQIVSGNLEVSVGADRDRRVVNQLGKGELLGEIAFLTGGKRTATVTATEPTELIQIETAQFRDFMARQPDWLRLMIDSIAARLHQTNIGPPESRS